MLEDHKVPHTVAATTRSKPSTIGPAVRSNVESRRHDPISPTMPAAKNEKPARSRNRPTTVR